MTVAYLDLADFLAIGELVLDIPATDLASTSRLDLAESALHAPAAGFGDVEFYPDFHTKAALLCPASSRTILCQMATNGLASFA